MIQNAELNILIFFILLLLGLITLEEFRLTLGGSVSWTFPFDELDPLKVLKRSDCTLTQIHIYMHTHALTHSHIYNVILFFSVR